MIRLPLIACLATVCAIPIALAETVAPTGVSAAHPALSRPVSPSSASSSPASFNPASSNPQSWPVAVSLQTTLKQWAARLGWPAPQFLTDADWPVEVPGSIAGTIDTALTALAEGFAAAPARPRISISANHVIVVSEAGAE
jgi:hypothetical protein